jgi:hypothetical protein
MVAVDKRSSLLHLRMSDDEKKFYDIRQTDHKDQFFEMKHFELL